MAWVAHLGITSLAWPAAAHGAAVSCRTADQRATRTEPDVDERGRVAAAQRQEELNEFSMKHSPLYANAL